MLRWHIKTDHVSQLFVFPLHSYAEVRAEQRREQGIEESPPEITADKVSLWSL